MTKPNIPRKRYDADWEVHARELGIPRKIEDADWKAIFSYRRFRAGTEPAVRQEITRAIFAFMRINSGYNNIDEHRDKLRALLEVANVARREVYAFEKYNHQRLLAIGPILEVDDSYEPLVLEEKLMREFVQAANALAQSTRNLISSMGKRRPGPATDDIFWLVRVLNRIVLQYSDHGPITRSDKDRRDVGNDRRFVEYVLQIAQRESGRSISRGTIEAAIRKLKVKAQLR